MSERRDGTGTGVWTHPAPLPEPPPDPLVCAQAMAELRASRNIIVGYWTQVVDEFSRMRVGLRKLAKAHRLLRDLLQQRVAELEAENERLRAALMPLETSSIASAAQEAAAATMQRDQLQAALELERRAVEALAGMAGQIDDNDDWGCPPTLSDKHPVCADNLRVEVCAACWARWAREQARAEGGVKPDTERSE